MANQFIANLKTQMQELGLINEEWPLKGCSKAEIATLKKKQKVNYLPPDYVAFLSEMGHSASQFLVGEDYSYSFLPNLKDNFQDLIETETPSLSIPNDVFVFFSHQSSSYCFFKTDEQEVDPPVYIYVEGNTEFTLQHNQLTDFFYNQLELYRKYRTK